MRELAEVQRLRTDLAAAPTDGALARLEAAIAAATPAAATPAAGRAAVPAPQRRRVRGLVVAGTAAALAAAVVAGVLLGPNPGAAATHHSTRPLAQPGDGLGAHSPGLASSAAQLVAFAIRAGAQAPRFSPSPSDWMYLNVVEKGLYLPAKGIAQPTWTQVGTGRVATRSRGRLSYTAAVGPDEQLEGWPGSTTRIYHYLATLPASALALRTLILANNAKIPATQGGQVAGAFNAIQYLMDDYPLPPRLLAELYAVVVSLPGVRYDASVTDAAGRHGVGLYLIESGFLKQEIIVNPRTYAFMGLLWVAVRAKTEYGTSPQVVRYHVGTIDSWTAVLGSGVVREAGQLPGR